MTQLHCVWFEHDIRLYDHAPSGAFIRRYVPELKKVYVAVFGA